MRRALLALLCCSCGSVTPSPAAFVDADASADVGGSAGDVGADAAVVRDEGVADHVAEASVDVGQVVTDCALIPLVGVTVEQCANDCHVATCTADGVRFVGCKRNVGVDGRPAQFYCPLHGPDSVVPTCVASCPTSSAS